MNGFVCFKMEVGIVTVSSILWMSFKYKKKDQQMPKYFKGILFMCEMKIELNKMYFFFGFRLCVLE